MFMQLLHFFAFFSTSSGFSGYVIIFASATIFVCLGYPNWVESDAQSRCFAGTSSLSSKIKNPKLLSRCVCGSGGSRTKVNRSSWFPGQLGWSYVFISWFLFNYWVEVIHIVIFGSAYIFVCFGGSLFLLRLLFC